MDHFYTIINHGSDKFLYIKTKIVARNELLDHVSATDVIDRKKFSVVNSGHKFACSKHYKHVLSMSLSNNSSDIKITRSTISPITVMHGIMKNFFLSQGKGVKRSKPNCLMNFFCYGIIVFSYIVGKSQSFPYDT